jgi:hypothetical protein
MNSIAATPAASASCSIRSLGRTERLHRFGRQPQPQARNRQDADLGAVLTPSFLPGFQRVGGFLSHQSHQCDHSLTAQQILNICGTAGTAP